MEWGDFIQQAAGKYLDTRIEAEYKQPFELQKMQLMAYGPYGNPYLEGQASQSAAQAAAARANGIAGIPQSWLLIGGAVLLVVMLAD